MQHSSVVSFLLSYSGTPIFVDYATKMSSLRVVLFFKVVHMVYANVCKQSLLSEGELVPCIAHGWVFDGHTRKCLQPSSWMLKEYPLRFNPDFPLALVARLIKRLKM